MTAGTAIVVAAAGAIAAVLFIPAQIVITLERAPGEWGRTVLVVRWLGVPWLTVRFVHARLLRTLLQARHRPRTERAGPAAGQRRAGEGHPPWREVIAYIFDRARICRFHADLRLGLIDAAATARTAGVLQAMAGVLSAWLSRQPRWRRVRPRIAVQPDFQQTGLRIQLTCILAVVPAHIIAAGAIYGLKATAARWQRRGWLQRGGRQLWPNIRYRAL